MGLSMGTAVGAAIGSGKPTLVATGDGGFMMGGLAEFTTAVRYGLDVVVLVFNDGAYGAEHVQLVQHDLDPGLTTFAWPELASVADALGGRGYTARSVNELRGVLAELASRDRPVLIDLKLDPMKVPAEWFFSGQ
jgi:thiamine pyrophosphate-dependent acetolactate synthase large subunit-like protein